MRANANLTISGQRVRLVPYRKIHVLKYHEWMKNPHLQLTTASEPLTLEEEYAMCDSWREDEDKCTFILLDLDVLRTSGGPEDDFEVSSACGDVNLYLNDAHDRTRGEIEVMVAEEGSRRKGIAAEALQLFIAYSASKLGLRTFRAQILEDNHASIALFEKLGFNEVSRSEFFKEVHLELELKGD
ncbi:GNAT domain-containing protein, partial [Hyaloraphidium curvatum]